MTLPVSFSTVDEGVQRLLTSLERAISDEHLAIWLEEEANPHVRERAAHRFEQEGDGVSGPWAPLAPATIADRLAKGYSEGPILHRSGELENYILNSAPQVGLIPGGVYLNAPGPTSDATMQTKVQTAQKGNSKVPARPVIGMDLEDAIGLTEMLTVSLHAQILRGI